MVRAGFHNSDMVAAAQSALINVKTVREELDTCEEEVEAMGCRRQHMKRSGYKSVGFR